MDVKEVEDVGDVKNVDTGAGVGVDGAEVGELVLVVAAVVLMR